MKHGTVEAHINCPMARYSTYLRISITQKNLFETSSIAGIGFRLVISGGLVPTMGLVRPQSPHADPLAFGFLDPSLVLRGCHVVASYTDGMMLSSLLDMRSADRSRDDHKDWAVFYVKPM